MTADLNQNEYKEITEEDNGLIEEFSAVNNELRINCTKIDISNDTKELYFLKIQESGGGGSYHEYVWLYIAVSQDDVIDIAKPIWCFQHLLRMENEHNRDNEC